LAVNGVEKLVKDNLSFLRPRDFQKISSQSEPFLQIHQSSQFTIFYHQFSTALNHYLNKSF